MKIHGKYTIDEEKMWYALVERKMCFGWSHILIFLIKP